MFDELVPPELRETLIRCADIQNDLERVMGWACSVAHVPDAFEAYMLEHIERMKEASLDILARYRHREITLEDAIQRLELECDVDRLAPPDADLMARRSSAPPDML